jgi:uncharacterized membrane protein YkvA (DUF1232 family)
VRDGLRVWQLLRGLLLEHDHKADDAEAQVGRTDGGASRPRSGDHAVAPTFLARLRRRARAIKQDTHAVYLACRDPRTPWYAKVLAGGIVAYALSPIDLIPDFVPILGYLDDLIIVPFGIALAVKMIPEPVLTDCRVKAELASARPTNKRAAAVIVGIWLVAAALVLWLVYEAFS